MKPFIAKAASLLLVPWITAALLAAPWTAAAIAAATDTVHLTGISKSVTFGTVKKVSSKSIKIKNNGKANASLTVVPPSSPFSVTSGGGSFTLAPKASQKVTIEFAPSAAGTFTSAITIECSNCTDSSQNNIAVNLKGSAKSAAAASPTPAPSPAPTPSAGANALPFSVNSGPFGESADMPYTSVTICAAGTSNCTTISNILIDTASFGLRVFASRLSALDLTPNTNGGSKVGECAYFAAGSTWGSVTTADVYIAGEPAITVPIQVIDDTNSFTAAPHECSQGSLISSPQEAQFYGLLGIGQYSNDSDFTDYYNCSSSACSALSPPPKADLVPNPVASFPVDNNGVVVDLSSIPASGSSNAAGTIYFGIGTESNNQPGSVVTLSEDSDVNSNGFLDINTEFGGVTAGAFFDTGSNGYFFNDGNIAQCSEAAAGFYCPTSILTESATNKSSDGSASDVVNFDVDNADSLFNSGGAAFDDLGGTYDGGNTYDGFDWGLPFFFGRVLYMGLDGTSSPLGSGPYVAY